MFLLHTYFWDDKKPIKLEKEIRKPKHFLKEIVDQIGKSPIWQQLSIIAFEKQALLK